MQHFTIHLPCKTYIRKYIIAHYTQINLPADNTFADVILAMLTSTLPTKLGKLQLDEQLARYTDKLPIRLQFNLFYRVQHQITLHNTIRLNRYFQNLFKEDLCNTVERIHRFTGIDRRTAIEYFAANHGIDVEIDITMEALVKMEQRYRTDKKQNKSLPKTSTLPAIPSLFG